MGKGNEYMICTPTDSFVFHNGQLIRWEHAWKELVHGGSLPQTHGDVCRVRQKGAWPCSGIEMFPYVSMPEKFVIKGKKIEHYGQHGVSRHLPWKTLEFNQNGITFMQEHRGEKVQSTKDKTQFFEGIFPFVLIKQFAVAPGKIAIEYSLKNTGDDTFCYDFGAHPAFIAPDDFSDAKLSFGKYYGTLEEIAKNKKALILDDISAINYHNKKNGMNIYMEHNFGNSMIWTPRENCGMFCIEPKTLRGIRRTKLDCEGRPLRPDEVHHYKIALSVGLERE